MTQPRALIFEDESLIAEELKSRLVDLGFSVIGAVESAEEGVPIAIQQCPDLILMDIRLKGAKDGISAAQEIHEKVDLCIVYLTAHSDKLTVDRARASEHDAYLLKPFQRFDLQSTIEIAMSRHAARSKQKRQDACQNAGPPYLM